MLVCTPGMTKRLVDIDDSALGAARAELDTTTIKDTVNQALRLATGNRTRRVTELLDSLADIEFVDRNDAWR